MDQVDGKEADLSKTTQFGSSDSVSRGSLTSTNSGSGRLRAGSRSSSGFRPKSDSLRARGGGGGVDSGERLESVPQGKDQDYIEYGESKLKKRNSQEEKEKEKASGADGHAVAGEWLGGIQRSTRSHTFSSLAKSGSDQHVNDADSADEYVELASPSSASSNNKSSSQLFSYYFFSDFFNHFFYQLFFNSFQLFLIHFNFGFFFGNFELDQI